MPTFYVENSNFDAAVNALQNFGKFNSPHTKTQIEDIIKKQLKALYPITNPALPIDVENVFQGLYCLPNLDPTLGADAYLLNLSWRGKVPGVTGYTQI